jgi:hypothetical protein
MVGRRKVEWRTFEMTRDKYKEALDDIEAEYHKVDNRVGRYTITDYFLCLILKLWIAKARYEFEKEGEVK